LAKWAPVDHLRKAELANGRSAMLATVGWVFPKVVGTFAGPVDTTDPIAAFFKSDPQWWAQFIVFCGTIEAIKYRAEVDGKSYTGEVDKEAAIDWAKQWGKMDAAKREDISMRELKNGRLAMIGIASFASSYFIPVGRKRRNTGQCSWLVIGISPHLISCCSSQGSVPGLPEGF
jgi:hypothetical protein